MAEGPKNFRTQRQLRNINSQIKSVQMQANLLPINLFEERNEVDRFDFSAAVAERFCLKEGAAITCMLHAKMDLVARSKVKRSRLFLYS